MSSTAIEALIQPPSIQSSQDKALRLLDSRFPSLGETDDLEAVVEQTLASREKLKAQVRLDRVHLSQ